VLVRPVAPPDVMADQLRHLLKMTELPNVEIRIMASTTPGYNPLLSGPFTLLEFATAAPVVHLEHYRASATLWEDEDVTAFANAAKEIYDKAMTLTQSVEIIEEVVNGMELT
jgi:hypothetical protein